MSAGAPFARMSTTHHTPPARIAVLAIAATLTVYLVARAALDEMAARSLAVFVFAAIFWTAELLPLFATALITVGLQIILLASDGGLADRMSGLLDVAASNRSDAPISARAFMEPFASDVIMLFFGGFLLAAAVTRHGVDVAIAARMLKPFVRSPLALIYGLAGLSALFSMWISNTATAAMMTTLVAPILSPIPLGCMCVWSVFPARLSPLMSKTWKLLPKINNVSV
jgi:sodium-dependent dicarboxylate transporter 2/3/5